MALHFSPRPRADWIRSAVVCCSIALLAASHVRNDPRLLAALHADRELRATCNCIQSAAWIDESWPRITVDEQRWRSLDQAARARFGKRALHDAATVYLAEWGTSYFYDRVFIVDHNGRQLFAFSP